MRTIETTIYEFDELSDDAKEKALDKCRDWSVDHDWWEYLFESRAEQWAEKGYSVDPKDIHFSGFWSQGDGACFKGTFRFDHAKTASLLPCDLVTKIDLFNGKMRLIGNPNIIDLEISGGIGTSGRYSHSGTMSVDKLDIYPMPDDLSGCNHSGCECIPGWPDSCRDLKVIGMAIDSWDLHISVEEAIKEEARGLADELYSDLEKEYEYLTSDEQVAEMIRANEREFDAEGNLI
jgi:hypothetical protein